MNHYRNRYPTYPDYLISEHLLSDATIDAMLEALSAFSESEVLQRQAKLDLAAHRQRILDSE